MIFKKDNFVFGLTLGFLGPIIGVILFKFVKFQSFSFSNMFEYMYREQGHGTFSAALSLALMVNAVIFATYIHFRKDKTAKGIFILTCVYGFLILCLKTFS